MTLALVLHSLAWLPLVLPALIVWHEFAHWLVSKLVGAHAIVTVLNFATPWNLASFAFDLDEEEEGGWRACLAFLAPRPLDIAIMAAAWLWTAPALELRLCAGVCAGLDFFLSRKDWRAAWST